MKELAPFAGARSVDPAARRVARARARAAPAARDVLDRAGRVADVVQTHARVGVVPLSRCPILPLNGWEQRDNIISIETTAGDIEIADPDELAQYERWASLLTDTAVSDDIEDLIRPAAASAGR